MRGPKPAYPIELTAEEARHLQHLIRAHTTAWLTRRAVGRRGVFPPQVRVQVTATACSLPCQHQVPLSRWSRAELARRVAQDPTLPCISASTVGRWRNRRSPAPLALSRLAAHPRSPCFLRTGTPGAAGLRPGTHALASRHLAGLPG